MSGHTETYYPKALARFSAKTPQTISLKGLAEDAFLRILATAPAISGAGRDSRGKKVLRKFVDENLPFEVQKGLWDRAVDRWYGSERMLNLLDAFEPRRLIREKVDLIGSFRYAYGCYTSDGKLYWSNGTIERLNLSVAQCNRLHQYISWSDALKKQSLRKIVLSTERSSLARSSLPNVFARSPQLSHVTILNGATNHVLRILGISCPNLKLLDISHSSKVTDGGISNLLLKHPRKHFSRDEVDLQETTACCKSLSKIILIGTDISQAALNAACHLMKGTYYVAFLPDIIIVRPFDGKGQMQQAMVTGGNQLAQVYSEDDILQGFNLIMQRFAEKKRGTEDMTRMLDHYKDPFPLKDRPGYAKNFLRTERGFITEAYIGTMLDDKENRITELILTWDSFTWGVALLPDLTELGVGLPHLTLLRARLQGVWERDTKLFPKLRETCIWTVSDSTVLSFLQFSPQIENFRFNCLNLMPSPRALMDDTFQFALKYNPTILQHLKEICIRPAALSITSARFLIQSCPHLKRLGDMESWKITTDDIKILNEELERQNSRCVLTVLSFPPHYQHEYFL